MQVEKGIMQTLHKTGPICSHAWVCKQNFEKWLQWLYLMDVIHPWGYGKLESR
jgi:hypothetical protein